MTKDARSWLKREIDRRARAAQEAHDEIEALFEDNDNDDLTMEEAA